MPGFILNHTQELPKCFTHTTDLATVNLFMTRTATTLPSPRHPPRDWEQSPHEHNAYLVQLVHGRTCSYELALWDAADSKHTVQNPPVIDLGVREARLAQGRSPPPPFLLPQGCGKLQLSVFPPAPQSHWQGGYENHSALVSP